MIIKADKNSIDEITSFCKKCILGTRILCLMDCYGFSYDFFSIYLLYCNDELKSVLSNFDGNVTLVAEENCDCSEVVQFIDFIPYNSITTYKHTAEGLGIENYNIKKAYKYTGLNNVDNFAENAEETDYKSIYRLISRNIPDSFPEGNDAYLSWLSDFTYRKRRNRARIKCIKDNDTIISCALTSAESTVAAIISGVACDLSSRTKGIGKKTVLSLANKLKSENKDVYVIALNSSAEGFYEHIGFEKCCVIAISER